MDKLNNVREGLVSPTEAFSDDRCGWDITQDAIRAQANAAERHCHILLRQSFRQPICGLDEACLTVDRLRLDRLPATTMFRFLAPDPSRAPPLPPTNLHIAALHFIPALSGAVRSSPVCSTSIETAMGAARTREKEYDNGNHRHLHLH